MSNNKYIFTLLGVNIEKVEQKYGIGIQHIIQHTTPSPIVDKDKEALHGIHNTKDSKEPLVSSTNTILTTEDITSVPENTTRVDELDIPKKFPEFISFLDDAKRLKKCMVSMIDFRSGLRLTPPTGKKAHQKATTILSPPIYKCYWCKNTLPDGIYPLGCPLRYIPSRAIKSYHSEISKERYTITENITEARREALQENSNIRAEKRGYYETDGIFCSFNCCMAFIDDPDNKPNPLYKNSRALLYKIYYDYTKKNNIKNNIENNIGGAKEDNKEDNKDNIIEDVVNNIMGDNKDDNKEDAKELEIMPAPHWRTLKEFGGSLTIDKFREAFNSITYVDHGNISFVGIGRLYEDKLIFSP